MASAEVLSAQPTTEQDEASHTCRRSKHDNGRVGTRLETVDLSHLEHQRSEMAKEHGELLLQSRAWLREVRQLIKQCDVMLKEVSPEHVEDVRSLQLTLIEIVNDAGDDESLASSDASVPFSPLSDCSSLGSSLGRERSRSLIWGSWRPSVRRVQPHRGRRKNGGDYSSPDDSMSPAILAREEMHELQRRIARDATPQSASARFLCCC